MAATSSTTSTAAITLTLSDLTADVNQFASQFELSLQQKPTWVGNLTTQTSQTLVELISTVGAFAQARRRRFCRNSTV
jgi:phage-related protein